MINNDVLRSLRYSLNINDAETLKVFQETDYDVALADLQAWLLPEEDEAQVHCSDEVLAQTDSAIADLCNTPPNNAAISASAAWLLHHFCPPTIPWAHLDISGTALWRENGKSVASGRPIPLLVEHLLEDR